MIRGINALAIGAVAAVLLPAGVQAASTAQPLLRWTVSADVIALGRAGTGTQSLVAFVPGNVPWLTETGVNTSNYPGIEALNSRQLGQSLSAGPKIGLTYRDPSGYGVELAYFAVLGLSGARATGPETPGQWLVMKAPGSFWQTQDFAYQAMVWQADTKLQSLEVNARRDVSPRVTLLVGLRWLRLGDTLQGTLNPVDFGEPEWKMQGDVTLADAVPVPGSPIVINPPFWTTRTTNSLYGVQIGGRARVWESGRFSVEAIVKAGVYANHATQTAEVSMRKQVYPAGAATNAATFVGEGGVVARYRVGDGVAFRLGYDAVWLNGVALAPGQIQKIATTQTSVSAQGVDTGASTLFEGFTFGIDYAF